MTAPGALCLVCTSMAGQPDNEWTFDVLHAAHSAYVRYAVEALEANGQPVRAQNVSMAMLDYFLRSAIRSDVATALMPDGRLN